MYQHVTVSDFSEKVLAASQQKRIVVDFYSETCGPCRMLATVLDQLHDKLDSKKIELVKVKIEDNPGLAIQYGIMSVPVLKAFEHGQVVAELIGSQSEKSLSEILFLAQ